MHIGRNVAVQEKKYGLCLSLFTSKSPCKNKKIKVSLGLPSPGQVGNEPCLVQAET